MIITEVIRLPFLVIDKVCMMLHPEAFLKQLILADKLVNLGLRQKRFQYPAIFGQGIVDVADNVVDLAFKIVIVGIPAKVITELLVGAAIESF